MSERLTRSVTQYIAIAILRTPKKLGRAGLYSITLYLSCSKSLLPRANSIRNSNSLLRMRSAIGISIVAMFSIAISISPTFSIAISIASICDPLKFAQTLYLCKCEGSVRGHT